MPLNSNNNPENRIWGMSKNGATVVARSWLLNRVETHNPMAAADSVVSMVLIKNSRKGGRNMPSAGKPTPRLNITTSITLWSSPTLPRTSIFEDMYALRERPVMYSRFKMVRSLQIS